MNNIEIINSAINFAEELNEILNGKNFREFYVKVTNYNNISKIDKYVFLETIKNISFMKKIDLPFSFKNFLTYDENLQKDIIYSFIINLKVNK